jgi:Peptidase S46
MKKTFLLLAAVSNLAWANEGMWMPQQLPGIAKQLKAAGLKMDPAGLANLTGYPMGAMVGLGNCSGSLVSPQGLVVTNHHCAADSIVFNSKPEHNYLENGFLAKTMAEELPVNPGKRFSITSEVQNVTRQIISPEVEKLSGKQRVDAIEKNRKQLIAACEKEAGFRCRVATFYGGLEYQLIKSLEVRDIRLVYAPANGVGNFGGETDNWIWPRHTGDFSYFRLYVGKDGKPASYHKENIPLQAKHYLRLAQEGVKDGDFVMAVGYPGNTDRHRLPTEVEHTFVQQAPKLLQILDDTIAIIERETKASEELKLKYADAIGGLGNFFKNLTGQSVSFNSSDLLQRKQQDHRALKAWVNANPARQKEYAADIDQIEKLITERNQEEGRNFLLGRSTPALLTTASYLLRLAHEQEKPDAERKAGFQVRDLPRVKARVESFNRSYDSGVDKALVHHFLKQYLTKTGSERNPGFDAALGLRDGMNDADLKTLIDALYASSQLENKEQRLAWMSKKPADFAASSDGFIKAAVAKYAEDVKREERQEEIAGKMQHAYASYIKAKLAFMQSQGRSVYPDANGTLRLTFGNVAGRSPGTDGSDWQAFTTLRGIAAKATGKGDFKAPAAQLAAIRARQFGPYAVAKLDSVPVNFLATMDVTGGASGSPVLNAKGELVGLAFDGTYDTIISDWDFNPVTTRSIQVDLRYMLWQMKVDHADNLLKEMNVK